MSKSTLRPFKVVAVFVESKKPYYRVQVYDEGRLVFNLGKLKKPEFLKRWLLYNQSLLEYKYVVVEEKRGGKTIRIHFGEEASRHFKLYLFYLRSIVGLKSSRKVDCLAKCWSTAIEAASPVVDVLWELSTMVDPKRFSSLLRGYCLCK